MDDNSHGTHVSGTIGAVGNNGVGVVGVNWKASIMGSKFLDSTGSGYLSDAINAIEFVNQTKNIFGVELTSAYFQTAGEEEVTPRLCWMRSIVQMQTACCS